MRELILKILNSDVIVSIRSCIAGFRNRIDPIYRRRRAQKRQRIREANKPYELGLPGAWIPKIMGLEDTLRHIIDNKVSVSRFGDGEFEIVDRRLTSVSFQSFDERLCQRLRDVLSHPIPQCFVCIINVFGSLDHLVEDDACFWRQTLGWLRPVARKYIENYPQPLGDPQISRPYMPMRDKAIAHRVFGLWKELFAGQDILIVEGRYSRLGVGNDLFNGVRSISRIWCPHINAFDSYDEMLQVVKSKAKKDQLILLALGQTATVMAYDLAREGYWAVDTGHLDVEYMWMKMGAKEKVAIPGRYVNEAKDGHETKTVDNEEILYNVIAKVGC